MPQWENLSRFNWMNIIWYVEDFFSSVKDFSGHMAWIMIWSNSNVLSATWFTQMKYLISWQNKCHRMPFLIIFLSFSSSPLCSPHREREAGEAQLRWRRWQQHSVRQFCQSGQLERRRWVGSPMIRSFLFFFVFLLVKAMVATGDLVGCDRLSVQTIGQLTTIHLF